MSFFLMDGCPAQIEAIERNQYVLYLGKIQVDVREIYLGYTG